MADPLDFNEDDLEGKAPPSAKVVDYIHGNASITEPLDIHHRIGFGSADAAAGNHTHDGKNSVFLFTGLTLTDITAGATGTQIATAVNAINAALRLLGAS